MPASFLSSESTPFHHHHLSSSCSCSCSCNFSGNQLSKRFSTVKMIVPLSSSSVNLPILSTVKSKGSLKGCKIAITSNHQVNTQRYQSMLSLCPATVWRAAQLQPTHKLRSKAICSAAMSVRCGGAEQTQTITREAPTITRAPTHINEKSPDLDDGGTGLPPRDDGDGGGGGGGDGGNWSGGFFFFGFLALLGFLKDNESDEK